MRGLSPNGLRREVGRFLRDDRIVIIAGWFADTLPHVPHDTRFAMVHVDADLYQSAIDCLRPLFERGLLAVGAMIIFDDWNAGHASNEYGERRAWRELTTQYAVDFEDLGGHSSHGRCFIVHSYRQPAQSAILLRACDVLVILPLATTLGL
jgi:hypothetical protein